MTSKTSWFSPAIFRKQLTGLWPIWALYTLAMLCCIPLNMLAADSTALPYFDHTLLDFPIFAGLAINFIYAPICAIVLFRYLFKTRSAYMFHAFPVRRETLFGTNVITGLLFGLAPNALVLGLGAAAAAATGISGVAVCQCMAAMSLEYLFCFGLAVLCVMLTGAAVYAGGLYAILHFAAYTLEKLTRNVFTPLIYGYRDSGQMLLQPLSPLVEIGQKCNVSSTRIGSFVNEWGGVEDLYRYSFTGWKYLVIAAVAGIVLLAAALLLYRWRHLETAGDVMSMKVLRQPFKYCFTLACTLGLGLAMVSIVYGSIDPENNFVPVLLGMLLGCALGYFGAEMMLQKTVRVFKMRNWYGLFACMACIFLAFGAVKIDLFGIERYVPALEDVSEVSIYRGVSDNEVVLTEPEQIADVLEIHRLLVENKDSSRWYDTAEYGPADTWQYYVHIKYVKADGSVIRREYPIVVEEEALENPDSLASQIAAVWNAPEIILAELDAIQEADIRSWFSGTIYCDNTGTSVTLESAAAKQLYACILADAAEGTIGQVGGLCSDAVVEFYSVSLDLMAETKDGEYVNCWITPTSRSEHTNAFLRRYGFDPEAGAVTPGSAAERNVSGMTEWVEG